MGIQVDSALPSLFNRLQQADGELSPEQNLVNVITQPRPASARDQLGFNQEQAVDSQFQQLSQYSEIRQLSLQARFQEAAAQIAQSDTGEAQEISAQARQLEFSFFAETRYEELVQFQQRMQNVADGLEGTQQETMVSMSQKVSARFEFSLSISGAALNGYANTAEQLPTAEEIFEQLGALTDQLLEAADDLFNEFFSMMDGLLGDDQEFITNLLNQFSEDLLGGLFSNEYSGLQAPQGESTGQTAQASSVQLQFSFAFSAEVTVEVSEVQESDPVILDLDGDGFELTNYTRGAQFDITGSGRKVQTAFVTGGDAFLALDRNGDGLINSGRELFGDQYGAANGYEELRKLDSNKDGVISREDKAYDQLRLFRDNGNGITEKGELISLAEAGIKEISLKYAEVDQRTSGGNRMTQIANFIRDDGTLGRAGDAVLNYLA